MTRPKRVVNPDPSPDSLPLAFSPSLPMKQTPNYRPLPTPVGRVSFIPSSSTSNPNVTTPKPKTLTESSAAAAHKLARRSQSKPNLRSPPSSTTTLKPKRSAALLLRPNPPSEQILSKRAHNISTHVPINKLPPELLSTIFLILSSSSHPSSSSSSSSSNVVNPNPTITKIPRFVSQVCHFWRCIALNEPLLWARTLNLREGPKWIIEVLKRSGDCAIDVVGLCDNRTIYNIGSHINGFRNSNGSGGGGRLATGGMGMLSIILKEVKRIRKLHLTIERKEDWRVIVDCLSRCEVPALESLAIKCAVRGVALPGLGGLNNGAGGGGTGHIGLASREGFLDFGGEGREEVMSLPGTLFRGAAPVLKNLLLARISLDASVPFPWLSRLTSLQVTDLEDQYLMSVWEWLSIVRQTPCLENLTLRSVFANEVPPDSPQDAGKVVLKRLRSVELKGTMMECCEFLERLVVPGECKIHLDTKRANNVHAADKLGEFLRERKMRVETMEGILKTAEQSMREASQRRRTLLVHPSAHDLYIKITESAGGGSGPDGVADQTTESGEEQEGNCVVKFSFSFGRSDQNEESRRSIIQIFETLTNALHLVYEDKGGFDSLNISLFGLRDAIKFWEAHLVQFLATLDRVEHLNEVSGYTASVVLPLLVQSPSRHGRRPSSASVTSVSSSLSERYRQNVLLPSLQRITFAFVEFSTNVDDEFEASCDVQSVPDFVRRRYGLGKEVGGISVARQRMLRLQFECCSGPRRILDELKRLGAEHRLGWACDFDDS